MPLRRDDGRVLAVGVGPDLPARARIQGVRAPLERREIDDAADHGRRAGDLAVRLERPPRGTRRCIEFVELLAVRPGEDEAVPRGRRRIDVVAGLVRPDQLPRRCAERVHLAVGRADVDAAVRERGRRVETRAAEQSLLAAVLPDEAAALRREAVEVAVIGADVETAPRDRGAPLHRTAGPELPDRLAVARVERVHPASPIADVEPVTVDKGRRLGRADRLLPADLSDAGGERYDLPVADLLGVAGRLVQEDGVDGAVLVRPQRRGCGDAAVREVLPGPLAGLHVHGDELAGVRREVETPEADGRRELDEAAGAEPPDATVRRAK